MIFTEMKEDSIEMNKDEDQEDYSGCVSLGDNREDGEITEDEEELAEQIKKDGQVEEAVEIKDSVSKKRKNTQVNDEEHRSYRKRKRHRHEHRTTPRANGEKWSRREKLKADLDMDVERQKVLRRKLIELEIQMGDGTSSNDYEDERPPWDQGGRVAGSMRHDNRGGRVSSRGTSGRKNRDRNGVELCRLYKHGKCTKTSETCLYSHEIRPSKIMELCKFYLFERCAKRDKCLYLHKGFPCKYFHTGQRCLDTAETCKFSHEPLTVVTRSILLKHLELAPKDILGDFPHLSRDDAVSVVRKTKVHHSGWSEDESNENKSDLSFEDDAKKPSTPLTSIQEKLAQMSGTNISAADYTRNSRPKNENSLLGDYYESNRKADRDSSFGDDGSGSDVTTPRVAGGGEFDVESFLRGQRMEQANVAEGGRGLLPTPEKQKRVSRPPLMGIRPKFTPNFGISEGRYDKFMKSVNVNENKLWSRDRKAPANVGSELDDELYNFEPELKPYRSLHENDYGNHLYESMNSGFIYGDGKPEKEYINSGAVESRPPPLPKPQEFNNINQDKMSDGLYKIGSPPNLGHAQRKMFDRIQRKQKTIEESFMSSSEQHETITSLLPAPINSSNNCGIYSSDEEELYGHNNNANHVPVLSNEAGSLDRGSRRDPRLRVSDAVVPAKKFDQMEAERDPRVVEQDIDLSSVLDDLDDLPCLTMHDSLLDQGVSLTESSFEHEINASLSSNGPIDYVLVPIVVDGPDYSAVLKRSNGSQSISHNDPRLLPYIMPSSEVTMYNPQLDLEDRERPPMNDYTGLCPPKDLTDHYGQNLPPLPENFLETDHHIPLQYHSKIISHLPGSSNSWSQDANIKTACQSLGTSSNRPSLAKSRDPRICNQQRQQLNAVPFHSSTNDGTWK